MICSLFLTSQNKKQQAVDDHEIKHELKKTKSKLQQCETAMKTMEEQLSQKNKELENTKTEIALLNKKSESKQIDKSEDNHVSNTAIKHENKTEEASTGSIINSEDPLKNKNSLLELRVNYYFDYVAI